MKAEVPAALALEQSQYQAAELLIAAILAGYRVAERPGVMRPRSSGRPRREQPGLRLPIRPGRAGDPGCGTGDKLARRRQPGCRQPAPTADPEDAARVPYTARHVLASALRPGPLAVAVLVIVPVLTFSVPSLARAPVHQRRRPHPELPLRVLVARNLDQGHLPLWKPLHLERHRPAGRSQRRRLLSRDAPVHRAARRSRLGRQRDPRVRRRRPRLYVFLRRSRLSVGAAFLGSLSFSVGGFMSAQLAHIDLVQGASLVPWMLGRPPPDGPSAGGEAASARGRHSPRRGWGPPPLRRRAGLGPRPGQRSRQQCGPRCCWGRASACWS